MSSTGATIVLPCHNEALRLDTAAVRDFLHSPLATDVRLLFVDDGSSDDTLTILRAIETEHPGRVTVLALEQNVGKAEAVRRGLIAAMPGAANVGFWDADLATPLDAIPSLLEILAGEPAVQWVFGARVGLLGRHIHRRMRRHYSGRVFATCVSLVLGLPVYDTQCGAKVFRADAALASVLASPFRSRWIFDVEMIARLKVHIGDTPPPLDRRIYEFPLMRWTDVPGSKVRGRDFVRAVRELASIWWWLRRARS